MIILYHKIPYNATIVLFDFKAKLHILGVQNLCNDTNFVINAQVFSYFVGNGSEKCPDYRENIVCHKRLQYKTA